MYLCAMFLWDDFMKYLDNGDDHLQQILGEIQILIYCNHLLQTRSPFCDNFDRLNLGIAHGLAFDTKPTANVET